MGISEPESGVNRFSVVINYTLKKLWNSHHKIRVIKGQILKIIDRCDATL